MSIPLRDWFAGQAMAAILQALIVPPRSELDGVVNPLFPAADEVARMARNYADAMMAPFAATIAGEAKGGAG